MFDQPRIFQIDLVPTTGAYLAGQEVRGRVYIFSDTSIQHVTSIKVSFHGASKVHWTEQVQKRVNKETRTVTKSYISREIYFNSQQCVMGDGHEFSLPPGESSYPFSFQLPTTIPSSFEHSIGRVWYKVKAMISRSHSHKSFNCKVHFSVTNSLDLNFEAGIDKPRSVNGHKHFGCFCCNSGPLSAVIRLNKVGFLPGESIKVSAEIDNKSARQVKGSCARIIQKLTFRTANKTKTDIKILAEASRGVIPAGGEDQWSDVQIPVPHVPPSQLPYCKIIDIEYSLQFRVEPSGWTLDFDLPLIIGTIPEASAYDPFQQPEASAPPAPWVPDYDSTEQPPPSYDEIFGNAASGLLGYEPIPSYKDLMKSDL